MSAPHERFFCGHCGDRLPPFGSDLGFCASCASRFRTVFGKESRDRLVRDFTMKPKSTRDPWLAAALALVFPGAGQVYNGHWIKALLVLVTSPFVIPWLIGIVDAYLSASRTNEQIADRSNYATA